MKNKINEKNIINLIRYTPILFLILLSAAVIQIILYEKNENFKKDIKKVEELFLKNNKERVQEEVEKVYNQIKLKKLKSEELLKQRIKNRVYQAHQIAVNIYQKESKLKENGTRHSKEHILETIKHALSGIIYDKGRGYIFIIDKKGKIILQSNNRKLENKSIFNLNNVEINNAFSKVIEISNKKTEDYISYPWFKDGDITKKHNKISFVKYFEPLNLTIGSGEYIEDFEKELKEELLKEIRKIKFGKTGYIFIYDLKGTCLAHFNKKFIGINRINVRDKKGNYVVKDVLDFAEKNKDGFMSYIAIMKPNSEVKSREKISYVKFYGKWNWVIGTGFYLDSLDTQINEEKESLKKSNEESIEKIIFISILLTLFALIISYFVSKILEKRFIEYKSSLEKQKDRLLKAQEIALVGDWQYNIKTQESYWSKSVLKMFDIKEVTNNQFIEYMREVIHPDDLEHTIIAFNNTIKTGEDYSSIYRIHRPNNEIRWINSKASINEDKTHIIGVAQDITEIKELEEEKKQKEEMLFQQSKMAAMGEMLGNIAHQWRQPLSTISTASTGAKLQKEMDCLTDTQLYSALDAINYSAQFLSKTIDDFRGFFNPNNSKVNEFNISNTLSKTLKLIESQFTAKDIEIIKNIESYELLSIENELIQVLINILNNARDILITNKEERKLIFISTYRKDNISYIEIKDNGKGIRKDIIKRIFEPYFTTKHQSIGTGIGLYMSEEIVKNHLNGTLTVENETYKFDGVKYKGAKFTITLPLS